MSCENPVSCEQKKNRRHEGLVFLLYAMLTLIVYVAPMTKFLIPYVIAAGLMLVSVPAMFWSESKLQGISVFLCACSVVLLVLYFFAGATLTDAVNEGIRNIRFFLPALWGYYLLRHCNRKKCTLALLLFLALTAVILYQTMLALEQEPWITRFLAQGTHQSDSVLDAYRMRNVGGFEFSYMLAIVVFCLVWTVFESERLLVKLLSVAGAILCFYYIIETMYTTLLILTAVGILLIVFLRVKNPIARVCLFVCGLMLIFFLEFLFGFLSTVFPEESLLSTKFAQLSSAMESGDISETGNRFLYMTESIENWIKNPLFGKINSESHAHSLLISTLENTGLVGVSLLLAMFYLCCHMLADELKTQKIDRRLFWISTAYVFTLAFFNPIGYVFEVTIVAFFVVPLWLKSITVKG